jgi:uncharacterized membrane protein
VSAPQATTDSAERCHRGSEEYLRVLAFSDGIFAIAMTLLVAGIAVPEVPREDLASALADDADALVSFALSFAVIGFYWLAHHRLFRRFAFLDAALVRWNLAYLCLIAFLPFPTALLGRYDGAPIAVALYAAAVAVLSLIEALMLRRGRMVGAFDRAPSDRAYRELMRASLAPVVLFLASVPLAFAHPAAAMGVWAAVFPLEHVFRRLSADETLAWQGGRRGRRPPGARPRLR